MRLTRGPRHARFSRAGVARLALAVGLLFAASCSFAQSKTGDTPLSIKAASPQSASLMPFRAIKKLDADIQSCIEGKLKGGALKDDGISVKVNGGEAVLEGKTSVSGHKGGATQIAKGCGAQKVTNNITVESKPKPTPAPKK